VPAAGEDDDNLTLEDAACAADGTGPSPWQVGAHAHLVTGPPASAPAGTVAQPHALRASGEPDTGEVDDDLVLGKDDAGAANGAGPCYCQAGAQAHLAADPPALACTMAQPHALTSTLLVPRWLVKIKVVPGATSCPKWLEAVAKLLQARNVSFSGGGASKLVQDEAERSNESHGESTEPEWLAIAANILYASSDSSSDSTFEAYYELNATAAATDALGAGASPTDLARVLGVELSTVWSYFALAAAHLDATTLRHRVPQLVGVGLWRHLNDMRARGDPLLGGRLLDFAPVCSVALPAGPERMAKLRLTRVAVTKQIGSVVA